jgi:histidinol-phosphate aminotransferase
VFFFVEREEKMSYIRKRKNLEVINPYVPGKPIEEVERELGVKVMAKLASNENTLGPSPLAVSAIIDSALHVNLYPDGSCYYLRNALAGKIGVDSEQLMITNGADEALSLISRTYINPGDETVVPEPSFPKYEFNTQVMDGIPRLISLNKDFNYNIEAMLSAVSSRTRIFYLCSPNNPTGGIVTESEFELVIERLPENIIIVVDEAYYEYVTEPDYFDTIKYVKKGYPIISLRTFSKIYGLAGLRVGYMIADKKIIKDIHTVRETFNVNRVAQAAALAALEDNAHVKKSLEIVESGKRLLYRGLESLGLRCYPTHTNFIFVDFMRDTNPIFRDLLVNGVIIRPGDIYGYPECARITIGTENENILLIEKVKKVLEN